MTSTSNEAPSPEAAAAAPAHLPDPQTTPAERSGEPPVPRRRWVPELAVPARTLPLLLLLLAAGTVVLLFVSRNVHRWNPAELQADAMAKRAHFQTTYWLEHGYFASGGLLVSTSPAAPLSFYRSSTGGVFLPGFIVQKIYMMFSGRYSWRLMAFQNQVFMLLASAFLALLGFRLAQLVGATPSHALLLAISLEAVHFTFPDNLMTYWEMSARIPWLLFACVFLLFEVKSLAGRTRLISFGQAVCAFALTYMEFVAGVTFVASYMVLAFLLTRERVSWKRLLLIGLLPMLLALGVYKMQLTWVRTHYPKVPMMGSEFSFRSGFDGSLTYYGDHLDIFKRRDVPRRDFPHTGPWLFRWKWLFLSSTASLLAVLYLAMRGRVEMVVVVSILSLLGAYLMYAALFSQAMVIHPYLYDVMIFTPLVLTFLAVAPSILENYTHHRGLAVAAVFFIAVWVSMGQVRRYAVQYPVKPVLQVQP